MVRLTSRIRKVDATDTGSDIVLHDGLAVYTDVLVARCVLPCHPLRYRYPHTMRERGGRHIFTKKHIIHEGAGALK